MKLETDDDQIMAVAAFRYCLGRQSYIVGIGIDWLTKHWKQFTSNTQNIILRDTLGAIMDDMTGSKYDTEDWRQFSQAHWAKVTEDQRIWVRGALRHKQKPWPLATEEELDAEWRQERKHSDVDEGCPSLDEKF